jgi:aryl-alcohol dehydrogenase-like predicted oxidoreductase
MTAALGLGTYRCRDITTAFHAATRAGICTIDTAPVYADGRAQTELGQAMTGSTGVRLSSKAGFMAPAQAAHAFHANLISAEEADRRHSIAPAFIDHQLTATTTQLARNPDLLFLHNPERAAPRRGQLHRALISAFERCEIAVSQGRARGYGVATWDGFDEGAFTVTSLVDAALTASAGESCHLRAVQLPVSLVRLHPLIEALRSDGPLAEAPAAGLEVWASAPLHGGELARIATPALAALIAPGLTPVQAALSVVASAPGISTVLLSASSSRHWSEAVGLTSVPPATLRRVCDVLRG